MNKEFSFAITFRRGRCLLDCAIDLSCTGNAVKVLSSGISFNDNVTGIDPAVDIVAKVGSGTTISDLDVPVDCMDTSDIFSQ